MQGKSYLLATVAAVALLASTGAGFAKSTPSDPSPSTPVASGPSNGELAARIDALEAELAAERDRRIADHNRLSGLEQSFNDVVWSFDNGRPTIKSGDGRFSMAIRARFQADFASFSQDAHAAPFAGPADLSTGAVVRRAYFGIEGKAYNDFAYELRLNAGGSDGGNNGAAGVPNAGEGDPLLNKAVVSYTGFANTHINVGVIEPNFMFEGSVSSANLIFLERPEIDNIAADSFGAGDSRRGVEIGWARTDTLWAGDNLTVDVAYTGGKTGSTANHGNGGDENSQILGRVTERLWTNGLSNVVLGFSGAHVFYSGTAAGGGSQSVRLRDRPEIRVDGTRLIDTGGMTGKTADMWSVDLGGNWENFFLGGEYTNFSVDRTAPVVSHPTFSGWYLEGSWIITGETKAYSTSALNNETGGFQAPVPSRPFSFSGDSWGMWELAVRYSDTNLNWNTGVATGVFGGRESVVAVALNWYLNRNVRLMLDDNIVHVDKGVFGNIHRDRQDINIVGLRVQFAN
jgi:phosphate-selective porin OprO/OprP